MYAWINQDGKFLVTTHRPTHTGLHLDVNFTDDVNKCDVAPMLDRRVKEVYPGQLTAVPARVERKVFIGG